MFVRKAKGGSNSTGENSQGAEVHNNRTNNNRNNNYEKKDPTNNNNKRNSNAGLPNKGQGQNYDFPNKSYHRNKTGDSSNSNNNENARQKVAQNINRARMGSGDFPALPMKTMEVKVPIFPLTEEDEFVAEQKKISKNEYIKKFQELKDENKLVMPKSLASPKLQNVPVILKEGDLRLECIEPTPYVEPEMKSSGRPSRKVSYNYESPNKSKGNSGRKFSSPSGGEMKLTRSRLGSEKID